MLSSCPNPSSPCFQSPKSFISSILITQVTCSVIFPTLISLLFLFSIPFHRAKYSQITFFLAFHHPSLISSVFSFFHHSNLHHPTFFFLSYPFHRAKHPHCPEILQFNTVNSLLDGINLIQGNCFLPNTPLSEFLQGKTNPPKGPFCTAGDISRHCCCIQRASGIFTASPVAVPNLSSPLFTP